jgi:peptide/nickel transport system ATP-binding protein
MTPLLEIRDLHVSLQTLRGRASALRQLHLTIGRGETVGLIGESGCGKSMTALAIMGLLPERAEVRGSMMLAAPAESSNAPLDLVTQSDATLCRIRGRRIGMVFQEPMTALNPLHTVGAQIAEPLRWHLGLGAREARGEALKLLEQVQLPEPRSRLDAYPHQLSGGQRQRVGIAMALACGPDLLIADEPTTALDVTIQREILDLLAGLTADRGMAMLLISHDLAMMAHSVQTVHVMYGGLIVESGPTRRVFESLAHPYTRGLFGARPRIGRSRGLRLATIPGRVPELVDLPAGCPFAERCGFAVAACRTDMPAVQPVMGTHEVRCLRAGDPALLDVPANV